jgi:hypothetical protein
MNIWNKVFLGVVIAMAIAVVMLGAVELKVRTTGQKHTDDLKKKIEDTDAKITRINEGTAPTKLSVDKKLSELSLEELKGKVKERGDERGTAWSGCKVTRIVDEVLMPIQPQPGAKGLPRVKAEVTITSPFIPNPAGAETDVVPPEQLRGVVYVFAEGAGNNADVFLGRFDVEGTPTETQFLDEQGNQKKGYRVTLVTFEHISKDEIDQIKDTSKTWVLHLSPPLDRVAGVFDQLTEEQKQAIPVETREKFQPRPMPPLTDEEIAGQDPKVVEVWRKIRETLDDPEAKAARDFSIMLSWLYQQRSDISRRIAEAETDIGTYKTAKAKTDAENEKYTEDCDREDKRVAAMNVQHEKVKTLLGEYEEEIAKLALQSEKLQILSEVYVEKITEYQVKAVEEIESGIEEEIGDRR